MVLKSGSDGLLKPTVLASTRPKLVHATEFFRSKFWTNDSESSVDEEIVVKNNNISTPEFIAAASSAGLLVDDLLQAKQELSETHVCLSTSQVNLIRAPLATEIIRSLVKHNSSVQP